MRILAIDTALEACSAAVLDTELGAVVARESMAMARGHAEALMPLIARVMEEGGLDFTQIDRIAVTTGPGSFTGMRVGIAAARGLALATGILIVPNAFRDGVSEVMDFQWDVPSGSMWTSAAPSRRGESPSGPRRQSRSRSARRRQSRRRRQ